MDSKLENTIKTKDFEVERVDSPILSAEYLKVKGYVWKRQVDKGRKVGKRFHDGTLYRYLGQHDVDGVPHIQLGQMGYSDRLFKKAMSPSEIEQRFGKEHNMFHCLVQVILLTTNMQIVVGKKAISSYLERGLLSHVCGNMNHDEVEVNCAEDVFTMAMKELLEETGIVPNRDRISFLNLTEVNQSVSFNFLYRLAMH